MLLYFLPWILIQILFRLTSMIMLTCYLFMEILNLNIILILCMYIWWFILTHSEKKRFLNFSFLLYYIKILKTSTWLITFSLVF